LNLGSDDGVVAVLGGLGKELMDFGKVSISQSSAPSVHAVGQGISVLLGEGLVVAITEIREVIHVGLPHGILHPDHSGFVSGVREPRTSDPELGKNSSAEVSAVAMESLLVRGLARCNRSGLKDAALVTFV